MIKKMRVLIAEDEIAIANLIKNLIDFDRLNLENCGIALNGIKALELIEKEKPDIVITDISMPLLNGLDLISKVQEIGFTTHFIIVSGMTHFQYALSAIQMGVEGYLLKPINQVELNDVLEKTIIKIATARKIDYQIQKLTQDSHIQTQMLRRSFITDLLYNRPSQEVLSVEKLNEKYGFSFLTDTQFLTGIVQIDGITKMKLPIQNTIIEQLMRIFQTTIKDHCIDNEVYNKNNQFIFLVNFHPEKSSMALGTISVIHEDLNNHIGSYDGLTVAVSRGTTVSNVEMIRHSLTTAYEALNARIMMGSSRTLFADNLLSGGKKPTFILLESEINSLRSQIEIRNQKETRSALISLFKKAAQDVKSCPHLLPEIYRDTVSDILSNLHRYKLIDGSLTDYYMQYCDRMEQFYTLKELIKYTVTFIMDLLPFSNDDDKDDQENRLIQTAKTYIQEHYSENLKLETLAELIYLAPSYFGTIFKKETGESFSSYLTTIRLEKAKEFLRDAKYSIADVAIAVGYQDKRYFGKLFKEQVGVTPREFRKIYMR